MDWFDLLALQGAFKSLLQHDNWKHQFFSTHPFLWSNSHVHTWWCKNHSCDYTELCWQSDVFAFKYAKHVTSRQVEREKWKQWHILFSWVQKSLQMVTAIMKLKDACPLEGAVTYLDSMSTSYLYRPFQKGNRYSTSRSSIKYAQKLNSQCVKLDIRQSENQGALIKESAAAKSLQLCLNLCNPTDSSPPGSPVPGILQARTLEWVSTSFSNAWKWKMKVKSLSRVWLSDPVDCSPPGSSIHGIFQARALEWGAIAFSHKGVYCLVNADTLVLLSQIDQASVANEGSFSDLWFCVLDH